jgi:glycosyltransferase involved in cell wall biosynthesis
MLLQQNQPVHLVCTGPTQDYRNLEYFAALQYKLCEWGIEPLVHIVGMIPRYDQIMLIRGASAVIQPSLFEGWSTVLEDARALGQRVIATDFPVHIEQNVPGAIYFKQGDATDCAQAIQQHFASLGEWERVRVQHSPEKHDARLVEYAQSFMSIVDKVTP